MLLYDFFVKSKEKLVELVCVTNCFQAKSYFEVQEKELLLFSKKVMSTNNILSSILSVLVPSSLSRFSLSGVKDYKDRIEFRM